MQQTAPQSIAERLLRFLREGITPGRLAFSVALGMGISCFPIFGTTTIVCALVALALGLNLPAIEVGNYLALPLQLILFVPFLRLGERLTHSVPLPLSPGQLLALMKTSPDATMKLLIAAQWHSIIGWLVVAPGITLLLFLVLLPCIRLLIGRARLQPQAAAVTILR